ncbi:MAG: sigma-70 family RNA polymerase sigma factor [Rubripirellula sp.]
MSELNQTERFVQHLTEHQTRLYGYIYSLVGDHSRAADVLQETNLVLWRKIEQFEPHKPFLPWAFTFARFQVMAHFRDQKRDKLLLDVELVELIAADAEQHASELDKMREMLRPCLSLLTPSNRDLIEQRYDRGLSIARVAETVDRSVGAVKVALLRVRRQLADCVQERMGPEI